jgi:hypothetical protein
VEVSLGSLVGYLSENRGGDRELKLEKAVSGLCGGKSGRVKILILKLLLVLLYTKLLLLLILKYLL